MAAVVSVFKRLIPFGGGGQVPGGLHAEVWSIPASTDGDTQTITARFLTEILYVVGANHAAPSGNTVAITTLATVDSSTTNEILVIGKR